MANCSLALILQASNTFKEAILIQMTYWLTTGVFGTTMSKK
jgi:hypothetical protein